MVVHYIVVPIDSGGQIVPLSFALPEKKISHMLRHRCNMHEFLAFVLNCVSVVSNVC